MEDQRYYSSEYHGSLGRHCLMYHGQGMSGTYRSDKKICGPPRSVLETVSVNLKREILAVGGGVPC